MNSPGEIGLPKSHVGIDESIWAHVGTLSGLLLSRWEMEQRGRVGAVSACTTARADKVARISESKLKAVIVDEGYCYRDDNVVKHEGDTTQCLIGSLKDYLTRRARKRPLWMEHRHAGQIKKSVTEAAGRLLPFLSVYVCLPSLLWSRWRKSWLHLTIRWRWDPIFEGSTW